MLTRKQILKVQRMDRQYGGGDRDPSCTSLRSGMMASSQPAQTPEPTGAAEGSRAAPSEATESGPSIERTPTQMQAELALRHSSAPPPPEDD